MKNALLVTCFLILFCLCLPFFLAETYNWEGTLVFTCWTVHMALKALVHSILSLPVRAVIFDSLRRRANARNASFRVSLRLPTYIINPVDKSKLSCNTPHRRSTTVPLETHPIYF